MANKNKTLADVKNSNAKTNSDYADRVNEYVKKCLELESEGMQLLYAPSTADIGSNIPTSMMEHYGGGGGCGCGSESLQGFGPISSRNGQLFLASYSTINMGEGEGAIPWGGIRNRMPLDIYNTSKDLPYSAAGLRYNYELMEGLGPKVVYKYLEIVNGVPKEKSVPFEYAGVVLLEKIKKLKAEKGGNENQNENENENQNPGTNPELVFAKGYKANAEPKNYRVKKQEPVAAPAVDFERLGTIDYELEQAIKDYNEWQAAWEEMEEWLENNNLQDIYKRFIQDNIVCDLSFMRFNLDARTKGKEWTPKIVNIDNLATVVTRYEKRDNLGNINHVYHNERWRNTLVDRLIDNEGSVMYPVIGNVRMSTSGSRGFKAQLKEYITKPETDKDGKRKEWLCTPIAYPSCENAYYPRPSWWSLYSSLCVTYASTYFYDKAVARANSTQLRYAIYVNLDWMDRLRSQQKEPTAPGNIDKVAEFRKNVINKINAFLRNKANSGKSLTGDVFTDEKGNEHKSFEVVAIPLPKMETASTEELGNISSIFSWAMGIHGALQGDRPGVQKSSSGGTFQRELHLLAQGKMSPRQRLWCDWVESVMKFNGWCPKHVGVNIKMPVLTTLDRNKTGIEEEER